MACAAAHCRPSFPISRCESLSNSIWEWASAGQLRAWFGDDTSGTPALSLEHLDNVRWNGIERVSLGLSNVSASLSSTIGTQPFSFSEIAINEPRLFWSDFESDLAGNIVVTGAPINGSRIISGNTCDGQLQFPSIASGTTQFPGLTMVHPLTLGPTANAVVQLIPSAPHECVCLSGRKRPVRALPSIGGNSVISDSSTCRPETIRSWSDARTRPAAPIA